MAEKQDAQDLVDQIKEGLQSRTALRQLRSLLRKKELVIITADHDCGVPVRGPKTPEEQSVCEAYKYPTTHPRHFKLQIGRKLQTGLPGGKIVRVWSAEGSFTEGEPDAVLRKLLQPGQAPA